MSYLPRRILPNRLYEILHCTYQRRYFFVPSQELNGIIVGALAYAAGLYGLRFCYTAWLSNHCHHLIRADSQKQVENSFRVADTKIAKEVQKYCEKHGLPWSGGIFQREGPSIVEVVGGRKVQLRRLKYLMSQGVKEGLVPTPTDWPGVESATPWLNGTMKLHGVWKDQTSRYEVERGVSRRKKKVTRKWLTIQQLNACNKKMTLKLWPLPFMDEMTPKERQKIAHDVYNEILVENQEKIAAVPRDWKKRLCNPSRLTYRPKTFKKEIVPEVHTDSKETWIAWKIEWDDWLNRYENASRRLRNGIAEALHEFPEGCCIPSGVFGRRKQCRPPPLPS